MTQILDGKITADRIKDRLVETTISLKNRGINPTLAVIRVGEYAPSKIYVAAKHTAAQSIGIRSLDYSLPDSTQPQELKDLIHKLNEDEAVHGILLQLPLPTHLDVFTMLNTIDPLKDVDGLTSDNMGLLSVGKPKIIPCTPKGCLTLLDAYNVPIQGKRVVVMGRSNLVGKPLAQLLLMRDATVTIVHSYTSDLMKITQTADILITAMGRPEMITKAWCRKGVVILDVGISRTDQGVSGDVKQADLMGYADFITPVPGGVGPMTVVSLLENTLLCCELLAQR